MSECREDNRSWHGCLWSWSALYRPTASGAGTYPVTAAPPSPSPPPCAVTGWDAVGWGEFRTGGTGTQVAPRLSFPLWLRLRLRLRVRLLETGFRLVPKPQRVACRPLGSGGGNPTGTQCASPPALDWGNRVLVCRCRWRWLLSCSAPPSKNFFYVLRKCKTYIPTVMV